MRKYLLHILIISFVFIVAPITSATGGSKTLRSSYETLSVSQVQSMPNVSIRKKKRWGFYGHSTIKHDYNLKTVGGDKVVVDNATGLMWHQSGFAEYIDWDEAKKWVRSLNSRGYAGHHDWRLPTVDEAASLLESKERNGVYIDPIFSNKQEYGHLIWTADSKDGSSILSPGASAAWLVFFYNGRVRWHNVDSIYGNVRPVRSVLSKDVDSSYQSGRDTGQVQVAPQQEPSYGDASLTKKTDDAEALAKDLDEWEYSNLADLGYTYAQSGKWKEALKSYKQAVRICPDFAEAHFNLGAAYYELGEYKKAIKSYKQAVRLDPDFAEAHLYLGRVYNVSFKLKKAIKSFKQAIRLNPNYVEAHFLLGVAYVGIKDRDSALEQYRILKRLNSDEKANFLFNGINNYSQR